MEKKLTVDENFQQIRDVLEFSRDTEPVGYICTC